MRANQRRLIWLGFRLAALYTSATYVMCYLQHDCLDIVFSLFLFVLNWMLSWPAILMPSDCQVNWYRRALFLPCSSIWGGVLAAVATGNDGPIGRVVVCAAMVVVPGAPTIWLVGALWIWRSHRRHMRLLAR
jgi:hypothetical protein